MDKEEEREEEPAYSVFLLLPKKKEKKGGPPATITVTEGVAGVQFQGVQSIDNSGKSGT